MAFPGSLSTSIASNWGLSNPNPAIEVDKAAAGTAIVDGDNGMEHLVVTRGAETAIEQALGRRRLGGRP